MLKAKALITDGITSKTLYIIGLSALNIDRLMNRQPIKFHCKEIGMPDDGMIAIVYGTTEQDIVREIEEAGGKPRGEF